MIDIRKTVSGWLRRASDRLDRPQIAPEIYSRFWHLAPTDEADEDGIYSNAILAGLSKPEVFNIALTGPYGSGKSSIIKSFLKKHPQKTLQISLASFLSEDGSQNVGLDADTTPAKERSADDATARMEARQEIERSILQQMLYGADANKLPFSRFKRIQSPGKWISKFIAIYIAAALFSCWHMFQKRSEILSGEYFQHIALNDPTNLIHFFLGGSLVLLAIYRTYTASYGVSLKSVSLKDIEITPAAINHESILNRHLDEIIYFFQSTDYELVVIEDLDRFNDPEIFVTLREINRIVNENASIRSRHKIRFIYAIRDDIFKNTDRTKFFEFIIPVIPIINTSNSIDMVRKEGNRLSLDDRLDPQFIREVSRYLSDLRLIRNIFNEFEIYTKKLKAGDGVEWNANKLLAVLIYKNVFPRDFEKLHRNDGYFANIIEHKNAFIAKATSDLKSEIIRIEAELEAAENEFTNNVQELRHMYAMALIAILPERTHDVSIDGASFIPISYLPNSELIDEFIEAPQILYRVFNSNPQRIDISSFQEEFSSTHGYLERKQNVERKSDEFKASALKNIAALRSQIFTIRAAKFKDLVRKHASDVEHLFEALGENFELARYLVFEGHLDDSYYEYTSLFHSGRLSPSDRKFLRQIRADINPEPDFQIDNPKEVIAEMREEDFGQIYVLNVKIVDCLLTENTASSTKIDKLFDFIASDFERCAEFFKIFYATGSTVPQFTSGLLKHWPDFVAAAILDTSGLQHVTNIVANLPEEDLAKLPSKYPDLPEFVGTNLQQILALESTLEASRLKLLQIRATDLSSIEDYPSISRFLFEEGLYRLSITNIDFIFGSLLGKAPELPTLHSQHYSTIRSEGNDALATKIESDFSSYFENVLLVLESNTQESLATILSVIKRKEPRIEDIKTFLERQSEVFPSLDEVPERLHSMLFEISKIQASWDNCIAFISSPTYDPHILTNFLNEEETATALSKSTIPDSEEASALRQFVIENDGLDDDVFASYIRNLSTPVQKFPEEISWEKLQKLVDERKILFTSGNLEFVESDKKFHDLFIEKNIEQYLEIESECGHDDEVRERLLSLNISDDQRLRIIQLMDFNALLNLPSRVAIVAPILVRSEADLNHLNPDQARALVMNAKQAEIQIALLNKVHKIFDGAQIREILSQLPAPYSDIKPGYQRARLKISPANFDLVRWLTNRQLISSWSEEELFFSDNYIRINNKLR